MDVPAVRIAGSRVRRLGKLTGCSKRGANGAVILPKSTSKLSEIENRLFTYYASLTKSRCSSRTPRQERDVPRTGYEVGARERAKSGNVPLMAGPRLLKFSEPGRMRVYGFE